MGGLDLIFVPGALKPELPLLMGDSVRNPYLNFLRNVSAEATHVTAVCTGALLLAAAGLLDGYCATTHWAYKSVLKQFLAVDVAEGYPRYVIDANRVTGGGISSGIDEALAIVAILRGEAAAKSIQLTIQYAPNPPYHDGDPSVAGPTVLAQTSQEMRPGVEATAQVFKEFVS